LPRAAFKVSGGIKQWTAAIKQAAPGFGQNGATTLAFEKGEAELAFRLADGVGNG
jgi:hypothetical protein